MQHFALRCKTLHWLKRYYTTLQNITLRCIKRYATCVVDVTLCGRLHELGLASIPGQTYHFRVFFFLVYMNPSPFLFETYFINPGETCSTWVGYISPFYQSYEIEYVMAGLITLSNLSWRDLLRPSDFLIVHIFSSTRLYPSLLKIYPAKVKPTRVYMKKSKCSRLHTSQTRVGHGLCKRLLCCETLRYVLTRYTNVMRCYATL